MSASSIFRISGLALIIGALLASVGYWLRPYVQDISAYSLPVYVPSALLRFSGALLILIGLPGMYAYQSSRAGKFGLFSYALTFLGLATLEIGTAAITAFVVPFLAADPATQSLVIPPGNFETQLGVGYMIVFLSGMIAFNLGLILYGIAMLRARVFPRWAALMIIVGVPAIFLLSSLPIIGDKFAILVFLGLAWCGYAMWANRGESKSSSNG